MFAGTHSVHWDAFDSKPGPEICAADGTSGREVRAEGSGELPGHPDTLGSADAACSSLGACSEGERPMCEFAPGRTREALCPLTTSGLCSSLPSVAFDVLCSQPGVYNGRTPKL